ncbi:hypothetical protein D1816_07375 [Aquimarina sp. AD10]|uniref:hypothetical protein n=1 Tax=Aquimarina sp. AD10 TaxID=1714849 RepID=UPI000E4F30E0|nr:hypothetical protein [Aquimarina sp. AD10]AXT60176.1 hypothetical protein D1816_07375 [Aquimarina sp. AD10]RKN00031.1 hypothetical protein D7033_09285 [Aquimarina sp. AD10]
MKKINLILLASLFLGVISCSSDDENPDSNPNQVDPNPVEDVVLEANSVSQGLTVDGANRITGNAPTPTGNIPFAIDETNQSGFLNSGFDITFDAPQNFAGAYLQVRSNDGTFAPDYLDIPSSSIRAGRNKSGILSKSNQKMDNEVEIDVNFGNDIPPGKFCYLICIYDDQGNISEPVEVCVEIEAWGGNSALVGTWNYTKQIENSVTILPGEESDCGDATIVCANEQELVIDNAYCYVLESFALTINSDGTYEYRSDDTEKNFDYSASVENCEATFGAEGSGYYISKGNWAYDEEEGKLSLVEFEYVEASGDQIFDGTLEDGEVDFDGDVTIDGSNMVVKFSYEDDIVYNVEFFLSK